MAKIQLGKPPKSFTKELSFPMLDGTVGTIKVDYIYRSRKDFAAFVDGKLDAIKVAAEAEIAASREKIAAEKDAGAEAAMSFGISETETNLKRASSQVDYIMDCVQGWNLDVPFDREAIEQLVDELPLAASTIIQSYREAMTEGRLGN
jgi:hypothetical protein